MRLILLALLSCLLMSSCQSLQDAGLASQVEVSGAKRVAVCQSVKLDRAILGGFDGASDYLLGRSRGVILPENLTVQALVPALPSGVQGEIIEGLAQPKIPANLAVKPFRNADYASDYDPIAPQRDVDLVIHVCTKGFVGGGVGGGYYNAAAGVYIPMGGGGGGASIGSAVAGYGASYHPLLKTTTFTSSLDVYVYRGADGKCLGNFNLNHVTIVQGKEADAELKKHITSTAREIVKRVFGH